MEVNELTDPLGLVRLHRVILVSKGLKKRGEKSLSHLSAQPIVHVIEALQVKLKFNQILIYSSHTVYGQLNGLYP